MVHLKLIFVYVWDRIQVSFFKKLFHPHLLKSLLPRPPNELHWHFCEKMAAYVWVYLWPNLLFYSFGH